MCIFDNFYALASVKKGSATRPCMMQNALKKASRAAKRTAKRWALKRLFMHTIVNFCARKYFFKTLWVKR